MNNLVISLFETKNYNKNKSFKETTAPSKVKLKHLSNKNNQFQENQIRDQRAYSLVSFHKDYFSENADINFAGRILPSKGKPLPKVRVKTPNSLDPRELGGVSFDVASQVISAANALKISVDEYLRIFIKPNAYVPKVMPESSLSAIVGNCKITTLIDGKQCFEAYTEVAKGAKKYIKSSMFEFQNLKVDGHRWPTHGAEVVPGAKEQQQILDIYLTHLKKDKNFKIQQILDSHKWYIDGFGKKRHYNNADMIRYMKTNGVDVVPYPRANQGGAVLNHVKVFIADGNKAVVTGMNMGSHSAANHDVGFLIEALPNAKNSEVDNIVKMFQDDWSFAWERVGSTPLMKGPFNKEEQKFYNGLHKEIKEENVEYMKIVGELFDNDNDRHRYKEARLDLDFCHPLDSPEIRVLRTSPRELQVVGQKGEETIKEELLHNFKTAKEYRGLNFVFTNKEFVDIIIDRHKKGELDAKLVVEAGILNIFPYCRKAYNKLKSNGVPVRVYEADEEISQRMHAKLNIFDSKRIVSGSANVSNIALNQNLKTGLRNDYEMHSQSIDGEIMQHLGHAKVYEELLGIPPLADKSFDYEKLKNRKKIVNKAYEKLKNDKSVSFKIDNQIINVEEKHDIALSYIHGYYSIAQKRYNAKEKYKRGNNECAISFESPKLARVFLKQFDKDFNYSKSKFDELKNKIYPMPQIPESRKQVLSESIPLAKSVGLDARSSFYDMNFENTIKEVKDKKYQGVNLYTPDGKWIDYNKVGHEFLDTVPLDITKASSKEWVAYMQALSLAESKSTWTSRYNKYNMDKMLATFPTLNSKKAEKLFSENLRFLHDMNHNKSLDVPITDKNGKLCLDCVIFDTETTGTNVAWHKGQKLKPLDEIVQLASIQMKNGVLQPNSAFNRLIKPNIPIPEKVSAIHGITNEMVQDQPHLEAVLDEFLINHLNKKNGIIVAYNSKFDITVLNNSIRKYGDHVLTKEQPKEHLKEKQSHKVVDPFILMQRIHPYLGVKKRLGNQYQYLFCKKMENAHDAIADVKGTADVLKYTLYYLSEHRKDKSVPLTLREVLIFQNGGKVENIDIPFDVEDCNKKVNFDKSYIFTPLPVDNYFNGYKLTEGVLENIKDSIGENNYKKIVENRLQDKTFNLNDASHFPINPAESERIEGSAKFKDAEYTMLKNFDKVLGFAELEPYKEKTKDDIHKLIIENSKKYIRKKAIPVWIKNVNPEDIKAGNDLPDFNIAKRVLIEQNSN